MEVTKAQNWYWKNLGDALQASAALQQIRQAVMSHYPDAQHNPQIAVFWRQISDTGLHCEVNVYFSPRLAMVAKKMSALPCERPDESGLECLLGCLDLLAVDNDRL
ncbi:hypothetical protein [Neptunicella sp. SCSIO 80796]|uniref:hypothetical protein n=1 Tax=Neptunicella plasticusilytica TaxID=3117012 RepID=UPI003A4E0198